MDYFSFVQVVNVAVFAVAAAFSYTFVLPLIKTAYRFDYLDYPAGRKIHKKPMPFLGGVAVFSGFWTTVYSGIAAARLFYDDVPSGRIDALLSSVLSVAPKINGLFVGSLIILLVGLYDDKRRWTPLKKLAGQFLAAVILMGLGFNISIFGFGIFGYAVTFVWILMIMNAFNFIDSLDGHCAGIALISAIFFFWITRIIDQPMVGLFLAAFAGALLGFFPHNFKPAKIFLGDNGSLFIGYLMAAFTLLCSYQISEATYVTLFIPVLIFGVPIYDTLSVIVVRLPRGLPPWEGDRNHFAHRLVKMGMSDRIAVVFSYFIATTIGLVALLTTQVDFFGAVLIALIFLSIIGVIAFLEYYSAERLRVAEKLAKRKKRRREDIREAMNE